MRLALRLDTHEHGGYPQTWHLVTVRARPIRLGLVFLCGLVTGHELSETEWSYGGEAYAQRNCRWCDKSFHVPKDQIYTEFPDSSEMITEFDARMKAESH